MQSICLKDGNQPEREVLVEQDPELLEALAGLSDEEVARLLSEG